MKKIYQVMKTKKWAIGVVLLLFAVFFVREGYEKRTVSHAADYVIMDSEGTPVTGTYELRRAVDNFYLTGAEPGDTFQWSSANTDILVVDPATATNNVVGVSVNNIGTAALMLTITHADETWETISISVEVVFSVNEFLNGSEEPKIVKVNPEDERRSIVMNYNDVLQFGSDAKVDTTKLNLIFGDAAGGNAQWSSSNTDVVRVVEGGDLGRHIEAVGAGRATLSVTYRDGVNEYNDSITVYVRPELRKSDASGSHGELIGTDSTILTMEHGDRIWVSALYDANPLEGILGKVTWVIAKRTGTERTLVRDSLGNMGPDGEDVNLVFESNTETFRLDAKAGQYVVLFYVIGTYADYDTAQTTENGCEPVFFNVDVNSRYSDKEVTISINGSYNLSDAFNISLRALNENFQIVSIQNEGEWIRWELGKMLATGRTQGTAVIQLRSLQNPTETIPGVAAGQLVTVRILVTDTFTLNITNTTMAVGSTLELSGIIGSGNYSNSSVFVWDSTDTAETYVSLSSSGQYATVTAKRETASNNPVIVTLYWTNDEGITQVASCTIYVNSSAARIPLTPTEVELEIGQTLTLTTGLSGNQNLSWISSDTSVVTVAPLQGNVNALLTAGQNTGTAIVTVLNKDNNVYATCRVTVTAAITEISIAQGEQIDTVLGSGFLFLQANYKPANATNTKLKWSSSNTSVATVDDNGIVTLLKEGETVWISVEPVYNPRNIVARCAINIIENPVTDIVLDKTELDMIAGDQYNVDVRVVPSDATDPTLVWESDTPTVARVQGGVITAVGPGDANITVQAKSGVFKIIKVHVRNRLKSISFTDTQFEIKAGTTASLRNAVIFDPAEHVNTNLSWSSSNNSVVSVDANGNITGLKAGDVAWITCVAEDLGVMGAITCMVRVISEDVPATGVTLRPTEATMYVGDFLQIESVFTPVTATYQNLSWSSTDPAVATVDENGLVTAVGEGTVSIGAVYRNPIDNTVWDPIYCKITVIKAPVPVQGLALSPDNMEVYTGQSLAVVPVFTPADATDQRVTYQSSDESIANVDEQGMVTGIATGSAVIICRSAEGGYVGTCNVKVLQGVTVTLSPTYREIALGKTFKIKKTIFPEEYADTPVTWSSSDEKIATVSKNGKVKGVKKGTCVITCTLDKYNAKAVCEVKVASLRTTIKLNKTNIRIGKGQTYKLKATVWTNNSKKPSVKWTTSNRRIATVGQKGKVKAKKLGYATIMATTTDKLKVRAKCKVRVIRRAKSVQIIPNYAVCYVGGTKTLKAVVKPANTTLKTVTWKSSDTSIATVVGGKVRGIAEGTVNITATTKDGSRKKATCVLKVMEEIPVSSIVVAQSELTMKKGDSAKLSYTVLPSNTSDDITFASDNKRVARVSADGTVKAVGTGECEITIMSSGGQTSTVTVNVVALNRTSLTMRQYDTETLTVNGTSATVTWYSENARIATVENGKVTGRSKGTTYIYAYVKGCKLSCRVTITNIK